MTDIKSKAGGACEACCSTSRTAVAGVVSTETEVGVVSTETEVRVSGGCRVCGRNSWAAVGSVASTDTEVKAGGGSDVSVSNSRTSVAAVASRETDVKTGGGCCRSNSRAVVLVTIFKEKQYYLKSPAMVNVRHICDKHETEKIQTITLHGSTSSAAFCN